MRLKQVLSAQLQSFRTGLHSLSLEPWRVSLFCFKHAWFAQTQVPEYIVLTSASKRKLEQSVCIGTDATVTCEVVIGDYASRRATHSEQRWGIISKKIWDSTKQLRSAVSMFPGQGAIDAPGSNCLRSSGD